MSGSSRAGRMRFIAILASWGLAVVAGLSWNALRDSWDDSSRVPHSPASIESSMLAEMTLPDLQHREAFQTACATCHSTRLPMTQPTFGEGKWTELVHKMVAAYGAPILPDSEPKIVAYLMAAQAAR